MNTRQRVFLRQCFSNARRSPMILVSKSFWKLARLPGYKCCKKNVAVDSSYFLIQFQSTAHCFLHISKSLCALIYCLYIGYLAAASSRHEKTSAARRWPPNFLPLNRWRTYKIWLTSSASPLLGPECSEVLHNAKAALSYLLPATPVACAFANLLLKNASCG